jgi:AraC-like DNA-binding protein
VSLNYTFSLFRPPIKVIAESLGDGEVPSFARVFRKRTGQTPAAYRRQFGLPGAAASPPS